MSINRSTCSKETVIIAFAGLYMSLSLGLESSISSFPLEISAYDVSHNMVEIDCQYKDVSQSTLVSCDLVYGPVDNSAQVKVYTGVIPSEHLFKLDGLENNVTYHLHIICHNDTGSKIKSNVLQFTTGSKVLPLKYILTSNSFRGQNSFPRDSFYPRDDEYVRTVRSSSVILGAICGIVGFLIINVTIVMAVRKYSHRQMRRRRILEIEEREYEEFPYLRGYE